MKKNLAFIIGILITLGLAYLSIYLAAFIPMGLISPGVFAMLLGMALHPLVKKYLANFSGVAFVAKVLLKGSIVLMGASLSIFQVLEVGKYSLFVMVFTLATAFGGGNLLGRLFGMNWKLSNLISAGTGICGGSAIAAISPVIEAKDQDIAYAISATFIFDILMVILFPIAAREMAMSDLGYGLWAGTAVNDTSSVVAAGYAFSEAAGNYALIVKLTRTLSIIPTVLIFSFVYHRIQKKENGGQRVQLGKIIPWFIFFFLIMVGLRSGGLISDTLSLTLAHLSKFVMVMSLGAIGLRTNFGEVSKSGFKPMVHGFIISALVVFVSLGVQVLLSQF